MDFKYEAVSRKKVILWESQFWSIIAFWLFFGIFCGGFCVWSYIVSHYELIPF